MPADQPHMYLEAVPPETRQGEAAVEALLDKVAAINEAVGLAGVNIPEIREEESKSERGHRRKAFAPRMEPRELARRIQRHCGLPSMINRVVVHLERERQGDWFRETWEDYGVRRFVLVGGESSKRSYPGPSVPEANRLLREAIPDPELRIGNICIPTRPGEAERMRRKMTTGVDFFTTQILYHGKECTDLLDDLAAGELPGGVPELLLTLCPLRSVKNLPFLHFLGVSIEPELENWLRADPEHIEERSLQQIEHTWSAICRHVVAQEYAFPLNVSLAPIGKVPPATTIRLAEMLRGSTALG